MKENRATASKIIKAYWVPCLGYGKNDMISEIIVENFLIWERK